MKHALSLLVALALAPGVLAQSAPVIIAVAPSSGPSEGGTEVVITGDHFTANVLCIVPCPPTVSFGDITVIAREESDERLVAIAPAHPPATVDMSVDVAGADRVTKPGAYTFVGGADSQYERVLLPIDLNEPVDGAFGTRWMTDLWIRNDGAETVHLAPWPCPQGELCPDIFPLTHPIPPGFSLHNLPPLPDAEDGNPGRLLYVSKPGAADISFGLRFADQTRTAFNGGTELPVIREAELLRKPAQLFDLPLTDPKFRILLRIYDTTYTTSRFRVVVYPQWEGAQPPDYEYSEELPASTTQQGAFRTEAAYAQFDVTALLRFEKIWPATVRIEVQPLTPGSRYWAFASITNNDTQLVTLATPQ